MIQSNALEMRHVQPIIRASGLAAFWTSRTRDGIGGFVADRLDSTIFTGRPARSIMNRFTRELGPLPEGVPDFALASAAIRPLALKAEAKGSPDFTQLYPGQAVTLCQELPARDLTLKLATHALEKLSKLGHASSG